VHGIQFHRPVYSFSETYDNGSITIALDSPWKMYGAFVKKRPKIGLFFVNWTRFTKEVACYISKLFTVLLQSGPFDNHKAQCARMHNRASCVHGVIKCYCKMVPSEEVLFPVSLNFQSLSENSYVKPLEFVSSEQEMTFLEQVMTGSKVTHFEGLGLGGGRS